MKDQRFEIPPGAATARCRGCGAEIVWIKTVYDKSMPVDLDGTSHFATCPKADSFRRGRKPLPSEASAQKAMVERLANVQYRLSEWETDFLANVALAVADGRTLTGHQAAKLRDIYEEHG